MALSACRNCFTSITTNIRPSSIYLFNEVSVAYFASKAGKSGSKKKSVGKPYFRQLAKVVPTKVEMPAELKDICKGANYFKEGEDPPILDDQEYPDWLWELDKPKASIKQLEIGSRVYFRKLNKLKIKSDNLMKKQTGF